MRNGGGSEERRERREAHWVVVGAPRGDCIDRVSDLFGPCLVLSSQDVCGGVIGVVGRYNLGGC
jgi:hypothetical protein